MAFTRTHALRALVAASLSAAPAVAASDRPAPPSVSPTLLSKAAALPDIPPQKQAAPPLGAEHADRARAVLDQYYALSADAAQANDEKLRAANGTPATVPAPVPAEAAKPKRASKPRTPAAVALVDEPVPAAGATLRARNVIVGGGTAAWAALDALAGTDATAAADTLVVAGEGTRPYNRTPLSKEAWDVASDDVSGMTTYGYRNVAQDAPARVLRGDRAVGLDLDAKTVALASGAKLHFDKLLLATGGDPRPPALVCPAFTTDGEVAKHVSSFRTLDDYVALREKASQPGASVAIVGGGFLAAELAVALTSVCKDVSLVVADAGVLFRVLPRYMCQFIAKKIADSGVNVVTGAVVSDARVADSGEGVVLSLVGGPDGASEVSARSVVTAIGIEPSVELAAGAGLELDEKNGGVRVNDFMMAEPDVFVAGDVASFHDRALGRRRVEHWDHAVVTGRIAGKNMAGKRERYGLQSMFWADLSNVDVDITAVGLVDSKLETVAVWNTALPAQPETPAANELLTGVVYYVKDNEIVGVVLWNARKGTGALRRARALVDAKTNVKGLSERVLGDLVNLDDGSFRMCVKTAGTPHVE